MSAATHEPRGDPSARQELFIYYRVRTEHAAAALAAVIAMQGALQAANPGLRARLLMRHGEAGVSTWMETYGHPGAGIGRELDQAIAGHAAQLEPYIDGARHVEAFVAVDAAP